MNRDVGMVNLFKVEKYLVIWRKGWPSHNLMNEFIIWATLLTNNNLKAPVCFLLSYLSRNNALNYGSQTEVDGDQTITYYYVISISKLGETTSRTPTQKEQLKWADLSFWELENDMRKSLFRYERCQALPAGKKKYIQRVRNGNTSLS